MAAPFLADKSRPCKSRGGRTLNMRVEKLLDLIEDAEDSAAFYIHCIGTGVTPVECWNREGGKDDRDGRMRNCLCTADDFKAGGIGFHAHVGDDEIEGLLFEHGERLSR